MMKMKVVGISLMVLVAVTFLSSTVPVNSENMDDWVCRCVIYVDNTNNPQKLTDHQVLVNLDSNNFNFSQTQPDGDDLRFTNRKGDTLPYWIESFDSTSEKARIWVKVDSIPASGITKIFMHYRNPAAAPASNGTATFVFFDDFETDTTGDYTWEHVDSGPPPGPISTYSWDSANKWVYITTGDNSGMKVSKSVILPPHGHFYISFRKLRDYPKDNVQWFYIKEDENNYYAFITSGSGYDPIQHPDRLRKYVGGSLVDSSGVGGGVFIDSNTDHTIEGLYTNTMVQIDIDGEPADTLTTTNTVQIDPVSFSFLSDQIDLYWYEIRIRKYTDPEPTVTIRPDLSDWEYHLSITIDNMDNPQKLTDYQVVVELDSENFNFPRAQPDGDDLRFTNQNGDMLPYWIEFYDSQNKKARIWIKVDSIPASDTTSIIMYYGNPAAFDASDFDATFTKDSVLDGLVALWHMDEGSGTVITDSSGNGNDGVFYADSSPAWAGSDGGRWNGMNQQFSTGDSLDFDGIDDYVDVISVADDIVSPDTVFAFWVKGGGDKSFFTVCKHNIYRDYFRIMHLEDGQIYAVFRPANNYKWCIKTESTYPLDEWVFIVLGHDGVEPYLYVNGVLAAITFTDCFPGTLDRTYYFDDYGTPTRADLGAFRTNGNPDRYYSGEIDEVRIYEKALLPEEITALYERREYTDPEPTVRIGPVNYCDFRWILVFVIAGFICVLLWTLYRHKKKSSSEFKIQELENELKRIKRHP